MNLLDEMYNWYLDNPYPPFDAPGANIVHIETLEVLRWGNRKMWVFNTDDQYVAVVDVEPATEYQDWGDYGRPEIYRVEPYQVTTTRYKRADETT